MTVEVASSVTSVTSVSRSRISSNCNE